MKIKQDEDIFDECQSILIGEIIERIKGNLEDAGIKGPLLKELTGNIAFSMATTLDNSSTTEFDGLVVNPVLTFQQSDEELTHCGSNSYMHEYVFGTLDEIFDV